MFFYLCKLIPILILFICLFFQWHRNLKCVSNGKKLKVIHDLNKARMKEQWFKDAMQASGH